MHSFSNFIPQQRIELKRKWWEKELWCSASTKIVYEHPNKTGENILTKEVCFLLAITTVILFSSFYFHSFTWMCWERRRVWTAVFHQHIEAHCRDLNIILVKLLLNSKKKIISSSIVGIPRRSRLWSSGWKIWRDTMHHNQEGDWMVLNCKGSIIIKEERKTATASTVYHPVEAQYTRT